MISPKKVITTVEKTNEKMPAMIDSDNNVSRTLIPTFPQRIVLSRKFESFLMDNTFIAPVVLVVSASISSRSLVKLKNARFNPENMADCERQNSMPIHIDNSFMFFLV
jgi:hypothetical protein